MNLERIILPENPHNINFQCKFVQVYIKGEPYLIIKDPKSNISHAGILKEILSQTKTPFKVEKLPGIGYGPGIKSENYEAVGMGQSILEDNKITLKGISTGYCLTPNEKHLKDIEPFAEDYEIIIDF